MPLRRDVGPDLGLKFGPRTDDGPDLGLNALRISVDPSFSAWIAKLKAASENSCWSGRVFQVDTWIHRVGPLYQPNLEDLPERLRTC